MSTVSPAKATPPTRPAPRLVTVAAISDIRPSLRRFRLASPTLSELDPGPASVTIKLLFPREGQEVPVLPVMGPDGPIRPAAEVRPVNRPFTFHSFDRQAGTLDVDFILHDGNGSACNWARQAVPGMQLGLVGPMADRPLPDAGHYIFIGDDTALPAISVLQQTVGDRSTEAFLEAETVAPYQVRNATWIERSVTGLQHGEGLSGLIGTLSPTPDTFVWLAGEASAVEALRRHLRFDLGLPRSRVVATPYWKRGLNEETFHDERHRVMDSQD